MVLIVVCSCEKACTAVGDSFSYVVQNRFQIWKLACAEPPQWGAADAEIKVPSGENTDLKQSPFKAWSRSVYRHTCYAHCLEFLPCLFLPSSPFTCIFFQNLFQFFPTLAVASTGSCVGPQNKIGHLAGSRVPVLSAHGT